MLIIFCFENKLFLKLKLLFIENFRENEQKYSLKENKQKLDYKFKKIIVLLNSCIRHDALLQRGTNVQVAKGQTAQEAERFQNFMN